MAAQWRFIELGAWIIWVANPPLLFQPQQVSMVFGLRLAGGTDVVVKARDDDGRALSCAAAQARPASAGFPVPGRSQARPASAGFPVPGRSRR
jgi:hypothetical protein